MGVTVIGGTKVRAMVAANGEVFYLTAVQSWSKKDGQRSTTWVNATFGNLAHVLTWAIQVSADCEGGGLQSASGVIKPTSMFRKWLQALRQPGRIEEAEVTASFGRGWACIEEKWRGRIDQILAQHGLPASGDRITLNLQTHPRALQEILSLTDKEWPWRIGAACFFNSTSHAEELPEGWFDAVGYAPKKTAACPRLPELQLRKVESRPEADHWWLEDGVWRPLGWAYSTTATLIVKLATQSELTLPGSAQLMMDVITEHVGQAEAFADDTVVQVPCPAEGDWRKGYFKTLCKEHGVEVTESLATTVAEIQRLDLGHALAKLEGVTFAEPAKAPLSAVA